MSRLAVDVTPGATRADIDELAANLRDQDVAELRAVGLDDLAGAIAASVENSRLCWAARIDGRMVCIFGVAVHGTLLAPVGVPWMLGTPLVPTYRHRLARLTPRYIGEMIKVAPLLLNYVHAHNTVAVRWLKRTGFHLHPAVPYGPLGAPFHPFEMRHV